jgi:hypothetical protein
MYLLRNIGARSRNHWNQVNDSLVISYAKFLNFRKLNRLENKRKWLSLLSFILKMSGLTLSLEIAVLNSPMWQCISNTPVSVRPSLRPSHSVSHKQIIAEKWLIQKFFLPGGRTPGKSRALTSSPNHHRQTVPYKQSKSSSTNSTLQAVQIIIDKQYLTSSQNHHRQTVPYNRTQSLSLASMPIQGPAIYSALYSTLSK